MTTIGANHRKMDFTFAQRLEQLMKERKLKANDVQRLTGVHCQCIYEYVQGVKQPNAFNIKRIAKGLKVSSDWLLGLSEKR
ncbi:MAG: helix-turn-helix transcriptional regulator [Ruminococcus sp.]|nr:helix-turn-helix transcriptional regulator [Ruminococcus sp.]